MSRSHPRLAAAGAYGAVLARIVPHLEGLLASRLERLETKVVAHEGRLRLSGHCGKNHVKRPLRAAPAGLSAGRPSVVVVGARLKSDQRYCRALIARIITVLGHHLQQS